MRFNLTGMRGGYRLADKLVFHLFLVRLTRYDERGYPIMWWRSVIPSNSLAAVNALASDARDRRILGDDVEIRLHPVDETNRRFVPARTIAEIRRGGGKALIALVGVQTNQFPRAVDLARPSWPQAFRCASAAFMFPVAIRC